MLTSRMTHPPAPDHVEVGGDLFCDCSGQQPQPINDTEDVFLLFLWL